MAEWPLHGRESELAMLTELVLDSAASGVVLSGPPGVGKTRLGRECLRVADEHGMAIRRITATYATSTLPLGAVILGSAPQDAPSAFHGDQAEAVHQVGTELLRKASGRRLVMLVDDVHLLDQLSAVLVHQLVASGSAFAVLTARSGTRAPDPIVALWKNDVIERMAVNAVGRQVVEDLLVSVLGGPVAGAAVAEFVDRSEGNLLFLRELVLAARENGDLVRDAGVWRLVRRPGSDARLGELIESRLTGLEHSARECLEVIAFGEPLELAELAALVGDDRLVAGLEDDGLVEVRTDGRAGAQVLLAHPLIGEVLRVGTSVVRARQITRDLAVAAEARGAAEPDDLLRVATWRLVSGGGTPQLLQAAAEAAYRRRDYELAGRIARAAIAVGAGHEARLLLAEARGHNGHREEAEEMLAALAAAADNPDDQARIAHARLINAHMSCEHFLGGRIYREAMGVIKDRRWRAELASTHTWITLVQEGPRGGLRICDELWSAAPEDPSLPAMALTRTLALARGGRVSEALATASRARAVQESLSQPFVLDSAVHTFLACDALAFAGRIKEWDRWASAGYDEAVHNRTSQAQLYFVYSLAKVNLARGRVATAERLAGEAIGIAHQLADNALLVAGLAALAEAKALRADVEGATAALAQLDSLSQLPWMYHEPISVARAWLAVGRGDVAAACQTLESDLERCSAWDDLRAVALILHTLVRLGEPRRASAPLRELAAKVEGDLVPAQARHAEALIAGDGAELEQVAGCFQQMGAELHAAEAYSDGAVAYRNAGDSKKSAAASQRARLCLDRCEGASTPATQSLSARAKLTRTEWITAMAAAHGRSNRDIASAEHVSVRTVEARLQSIYGKLGISSRNALPDALDLADSDRR